MTAPSRRLARDSSPSFRCSIQAGATINSTAAAGASATGPPSTAMTPMKNRMKGASLIAATVEAVKNSRTDSNSRT